MSEGSNPDGAARRPLGQKVKRTVESKVLIPVAATIVSAAASYLARKLPLILEEKVLPKLRERGAPETVTNVVEQTSATLSSATSAGSSAGNGDSPRERTSAAESKVAEKSSGAASSGPSSDEREEERRRREERRRERKDALKTA
jgi:hypothetical protein